MGVLSNLICHHITAFAGEESQPDEGGPDPADPLSSNGTVAPVSGTETSGSDDTGDIPTTGPENVARNAQQQAEEVAKTMEMQPTSGTKRQGQGPLQGAPPVEQWQNTAGQPNVTVSGEASAFSLPDITSPPFKCRTRMGWLPAMSHPTIKFRPDFLVAHPDFLTGMSSIHVTMKDVTKGDTHWDASYPLGMFPMNTLSPSFPASSGAKQRFWTFCPPAGETHSYELKVGAYDKTNQPIEYFREDEQKVMLSAVNSRNANVPVGAQSATPASTLQAGQASQAAVA
eukprot:GEMP01055483.1.p1 GENE.GEMP01055483.1~~GEMP01055483.1.p1  ORF type:complete len:285 (+),score=60.65 GEMP01055483.1:225-1079(+)